MDKRAELEQRYIELLEKRIAALEVIVGDSKDSPTKVKDIPTLYAVQSG